MGHEVSASDSLRALVWRVVALTIIVIVMAGMLSQQSVRYGTSEELRLPVLGVEVRELVDSFGEPREGVRFHEAIDIPAPRGTPVVAAASGSVRRISSSPRGGLGVYQVDGAGERCFYYAHLDRYAHALEEGRHLRTGDLIGYVGTTGNAPSDAPHLHFQVLSLNETRRCTDGRAVNPVAMFR